jgi:hypothetical protein
MDVNEHKRLSNITLLHKLKYRHCSLLAVTHLSTVDILEIWNRCLFSKPGSKNIKISLLSDR